MGPSPHLNMPPSFFSVFPLQVADKCKSGASCETHCVDLADSKAVQARPSQRPKLSH